MSRYPVWALGGAGGVIYMLGRTFRPLFLAAALAMAIGGTIALLHSGEKHAAADNLLTIDILDTGMNPQVCQLGRFEPVHWHNRTNQVRKIILDGGATDANGQTIEIATGDIPSGADSSPIQLGAGGTRTYHDFYNPSLKGTLSAPQFSDGSNGGSCSPLPPTPTPSPTPRVTPTPIIAPTPTPQPRHPRCTGLLGCAVAPGVASDD